MTYHEFKACTGAALKRLEAELIDSDVDLHAENDVTPESWETDFRGHLETIYGDYEDRDPSVVREVNNHLQELSFIG